MTAPRFMVYPYHGAPARHDRRVPVGLTGGGRGDTLPRALT
jgi:hypothetical protein